MMNQMIRREEGGETKTAIIELKIKGSIKNNLVKDMIAQVISIYIHKLYYLLYS